jgi:hypothetical protein
MTKLLRARGWGVEEHDFRWKIHSTSREANDENQGVETPHAGERFEG